VNAPADDYSADWAARCAAAAYLHPLSADRWIRGLAPRHRSALANAKEADVAQRLKVLPLDSRLPAFSCRPTSRTLCDLAFDYGDYIAELGLLPSLRTSGREELSYLARRLCMIPWLEVLHEIRQALAAIQGDDSVSIIIFGSTVTGYNRAPRDLDLVVVNESTITSSPPVIGGTRIRCESLAPYLRKVDIDATELDISTVSASLLSTASLSADLTNILVWSWHSGVPLSGQHLTAGLGPAHVLQDILVSLGFAAKRALLRRSHLPMAEAALYGWAKLGVAREHLSGSGESAWNEARSLTAEVSLRWRALCEASVPTSCELIALAQSEL
jgi:hypothetical protein